MQELLVVLGIKIAFTTLVWAIPALVIPLKTAIKLGFPETLPVVFLRLLGGAYLALLVGYIQGVQAIYANAYPGETVMVGIVSNGVAFIVLAIGAARGTWTNWGGVAKFIMRISLVMTLLITVGLLTFGPLRHQLIPYQIDSR